MTQIHRTGPNLRVLDIQLPIEDSSSPVERHEKKNEGISIGCHVQEKNTVVPWGVPQLRAGCSPRFSN